MPFFIKHIIIMELLTKELDKKYLISRISKQALFKINVESRKKGISKSQIIEQLIQSIDIDDK